MGFCPLRPRLARPLFTISFSRGRNAASQIWPRKRRCLKMKEESFLLPKRVVFFVLGRAVAEQKECILNLRISINFNKFEALEGQLRMQGISYIDK